MYPEVRLRLYVLMLFVMLAIFLATNRMARAEEAPRQAPEAARIVPGPSPALVP